MSGLQRAKDRAWLFWNQRDLDQIQQVVAVTLGNERRHRAKPGVDFDAKWVAHSVVSTRENMIVALEFLRRVEQHSYTTKVATLAIAVGVAVIAATLLARG